jgi:uncharacterized protein (DUF952 family)
METDLFKILPASRWAERDPGAVPPAPVDRADGFVHLSAAHQVRETARKHFRGRGEALVLLRIDPRRLPEGTLRWEPSRGGDLFPHVYGDVPEAAVVAVYPLPEPSPGAHRFPDGLGIA